MDVPLLLMSVEHLYYMKAKGGAKGFLTDVNGTLEHIFAVSAILQNARDHGLPLAMTYSLI